MAQNKLTRRTGPGRFSLNSMVDVSDPDRLQRRVAVVCTFVVIAAGAVAVAIPSRSTEPQNKAEAQWVSPALASTPSPQPSPTGTPSPQPSPTDTPVEVPTSAAAASRSAKPRPAATTPSRSPASTPDPELTIGATIGLQVDGKPGLLVRHHDLVARVDRLSPASSALDKAEATFIVREGLAFDDCVSFEAASRPGFFLRRFFSDLLVHERSESDIYRQEATFCPVFGRNGKAFSLLVLFPSGFAVTTAPDGKLRLDNTDRIVPTGFVVRQPL